MRQSLSFEQLSLILEDLGEVDLMQPLIGVINEQLFYAVALEYLESIDIQEP